MCTCVGACESLGPYSSIHLFFYGNIATATVRGQQSITIEPRDHTLDMELTEGRSIVVNFQTALSMDEFRIQMYSNPMVQQIALAEFQQTFQSHSSLRSRCSAAKFDATADASYVDVVIVYSVANRC